MLVKRLVVRSVNPVQNVQETVGSHEEDVVSSQVLNLAITLEDDQLGQNSNGFQVDGEGPEHLNGVEGEAVLEQVSDKSCNDTWSNGKFPVEEGILRLIVGGADGFLEFDCVDDRCGGEDVEHFHAGIVPGVECCEEVEVAGYEY